MKVAPFPLAKKMAFQMQLVTGICTYWVLNQLIVINKGFKMKI